MVVKHSLNMLGFAATNNNCVVRTTMKQEEGWRIGPVSADNILIAGNLYRAVFDYGDGVTPVTL